MIRRSFPSLFSRERVTLVIDEEAARLLSVRDNQVLRWGAVPIPRNAIIDGRVVDGEALAGALRRLWDLQQPPTTGIILGLTGQGSRTTMVALAGTEEPSADEVASTIARLGFAGPDDQLAWQMVGLPSQRAIFALALDRALIEGYLAACEAVGIGVAAIDVKPLALIRAVGHRHAVIADLERAMLTINIVDEALPRLVRLTPLRAPLVTRPEEKVTRLVETLAGSISEYNGGANGGYLHPAVPIHLTGALADQPLLKEAVQVGLGHPPVLPATSFVTPADLPVTQYLANLGLALKGTGGASREWIDLNLLPPRPQVALTSVSRRRRDPSLLLGMGLLLFAFLTIFPVGVTKVLIDRRLDQLSEAVTTTRGQVLTADAQLAREAQLRQQVQTTLVQADTLERQAQQLRAEQPAFSDLLQPLTQALPPRVTIASLAVQDDGTLRLTGESGSSGLVLEYAGAIERIEAVQQVNVVGMDLIGGQAAPSAVRYTLDIEREQP